MKRTILATTVVVLSIAVFSCFAAKKIKNKVNLDPTIRILNYTGYTKLDTITNVSCQLLKIKNVTVVLIPITDYEEQMTYYGFLQKRGSYYLIKIHPNITEDLVIETCAHEITHLAQFESGALERLNYGIRYYDKVYSWSSNYFDRVYEQKAFEAELDLKLKVKHKISNPLP